METLYTTKAPEVRTTSKGNSKYITLVEKIYKAENKPQEYKGTVESLLWSSFSKMSKTRATWKRATFKSLLMHMHAEGCYKVLRSPIYMQVLANVSTFGLKMVQPIERWKRPSFDPEEQLEDLIDHCFATYPTPLFLISSFYESSLKYQLWYVQLGAGKSVKTLQGLPSGFTSKMMHEFRNTPKEFSVTQAIIRAQALGFGASQQVAVALTRSRLTEIEGNQTFWETVIQFFANQKLLAHLDLYKILEYLEVSIQRDRLFTMKGRTLEALQSQAQEWHLEMQKMRDQANYVSWFPSGVKEMQLQTVKNGKTITYIAKELLTSDELYQEGYDMSHCVADYIDDCYAGETSIFSLRRQEGDTIKKLATIEIDPSTLEVLQAEGKCNTPLSPEASKVLNHWLDILGVKTKNVVSNQDQYIPAEAPVYEQHERQVVPQPPQNANYGQGPPAPIGDFSDSSFDARSFLIILFIIIRIIIALSRL